MQRSWTKAPTQPLTRLIPAATSFDSVRRSCFLPLRRGASKIYRTLTCTNSLSKLFRRHVFASLQFSVHFYNRGFTTDLVRYSLEVLHVGLLTPLSDVLDSTKALLLDRFPTHTNPRPHDFTLRHKGDYCFTYVRLYCSPSNDSSSGK
jgi:hypothetical protein